MVKPKPNSHLALGAGGAGRGAAINDIPSWVSVADQCINRVMRPLINYPDDKLRGSTVSYIRSVAGSGGVMEPRGT